MPSKRVARRWWLAMGATASTVIVAGVVSAAAGEPPTAASELTQQIPQLTERDSTPSQVAISNTAKDNVCSSDAKWLRLRFAALDLHGTDSVTLTGSGGGDLTLTAKNWTGRTFHTRALHGDCVAITANLRDPASTYTIDAYQSGTQALEATTVTVAGAGDICGSGCTKTDDLLDANHINPDAVFTAGDNAYPDGTLSQYRQQYDPTWGRFKDKTFPTPGNHEYNNNSGGAGYFDYFGARAGERGKGYYSWDIGDWHFIALNANISRGVGSEQEQWLRRDLEANTKPCTAAYWHHPLFSTGDHGDNTSVKPFFQALYDNQADLAIVGHDHDYERFAPSKPDGTTDEANGVREIVVGTGGASLRGFPNSSKAKSERRNSDTLGVLKLTLTATQYTADFVHVAGATFTDTVTKACHKADQEPPPPPPTGFSDDFETNKGWTVNPAGTDTATTGAWERGDPEQTTSTKSNQVKQLGTTTSGVNALVTARVAGSAAGANDVDGGVTSIRSPAFVVPSGTPRLSFAYSVGHDDSGPDDYLRVRIVDGTTTSTVFEKLGSATNTAAAWQNASVDLAGLAGRTVRVQVDAADVGVTSLFEAQVDDLSVTGNGGGPTVVFTDDYETNKGWTVNPAGTDTATTGAWERGDPEQTANSVSIKQLGSTTSGVSCLTTGRLAGSGYGANDLDGGVTSIRSPEITLPPGTSTMSFAYNVAHDLNSGPDDYLRIRIVDGSTITTVFEKPGVPSDVTGAWHTATVDLSAFAGKTVRAQVDASDGGPLTLFEAQLDDLKITNG